MLALIKNNTVLNRLEILGQFLEGGWVDIPDGSRMSPAVDGWSLRGYELRTIANADPVPPNYHIVSQSLQIVNGVPQYINVVEPDVVTLDTYKIAFDAHLDSVAQSKQYDDRVTIATYTTSSNLTWAGEANTFIQWRDAALSSMFDQLAAVQAGEPAPTVEQFIDNLPVIDWNENGET